MGGRQYPHTALVHRNCRLLEIGIRSVGSLPRTLQQAGSRARNRDNRVTSKLRQSVAKTAIHSLIPSDQIPRFATAEGVVGASSNGHAHCGHNAELYILARGRDAPGAC